MRSSRTPGCSRADPVTGERGEHVQRLELDRNSLVFSYEHQVLVEA